ncbi:DUF488 family protein [Oxalobacter vibrioformis]|uniref:DUF488 family protein n=1 Tax=Oxalobacter vibrioformis TaxID=933080 RepID=A0A9E9LXS5_9BURK|nr:DUF488 family protein [Oxalobacter vibrioformis]NLC24127.1 DUF488 family protein [Oxalobacter sp.]WAW09384.1 DUF488 family protein [Oxalobacter vibrioformis]
MEIVIKRAYEPVSADDGFRVLIDRLWPRGLSKEKAHIDFWDKHIAPSTELRKWFNHEPGKFTEFTRRYEAELKEETEALGELKEKVRGQKKVSLIYGAKDPEINHARVLQAYLRKQWK